MSYVHVRKVPNAGAVASGPVLFFFSGPSQLVLNSSLVEDHLSLETGKLVSQRGGGGWKDHLSTFCQDVRLSIRGSRLYPRDILKSHRKKSRRVFDTDRIF